MVSESKVVGICMNDAMVLGSVACNICSEMDSLQPEVIV